MYRMRAIRKCCIHAHDVQIAAESIGKPVELVFVFELRAEPRPSCPRCLFSYLFYSSILSPHAKLEDSPLRTAPPAKKRQRGRLHATCR